MEKIAVFGCGAYMDQGYGCPGEWRCLKAVADKYRTGMLNHINHLTG